MKSKLIFLCICVISSVIATLFTAYAVAISTSSTGVTPPAPNIAQLQVVMDTNNCTYVFLVNQSKNLQDVKNAINGIGGNAATNSAAIFGRNVTVIDAGNYQYNGTYNGVHGADYGKPDYNGFREQVYSCPTNYVMVEVRPYLEYGRRSTAVTPNAIGAFATTMAIRCCPFKVGWT